MHPRWRGSLHPMHRPRVNLSLPLSLSLSLTHGQRGCRIDFFSATLRPPHTHTRVEGGEPLRYRAIRQVPVRPIRFFRATTVAAAIYTRTSAGDTFARVCVENAEGGAQRSVRP